MKTLILLPIMFLFQRIIPSLTYTSIVPFQIRNAFTKSKPRSHRALTRKQKSSSDLVENQEKSFHYTTLSFYKFAHPKLTNVESIVKSVHDQLLNDVNHRGMDLKGTLLFADEGVNAQMAVRSEYVDYLLHTIHDIHPFLESISFNIGETRNYTFPDFPFKRLIIRSKKQILSDGFIQNNDDDDDINDITLPPQTEEVSAVSTVDNIIWSDDAAGPELPSEEWHKELATMTPIHLQVKDKTTAIKSYVSKSNTILLDCRNEYESEMGSFKNAIPLNSSKFSDSWSILESILEDVPKSTRILTFCTGGIRCVKVNAYLRQKLNFDNTARLKEGIIGYERWLQTKNNTIASDSVETDTVELSAVATTPIESFFKGSNYVFDRRRLMNETNPIKSNRNIQTKSVHKD